MTEIAGRLLFSTIKTSNSKSQNDDEILHYRIIWNNHPSQKSPFHCLPGGVYTNAQVKPIDTHRNAHITLMSLIIKYYVTNHNLT